MAPEDLAVIADAVQRRAGICIGVDKSYLVESRLLPVARRLGLSGLEALAARLRASPPASLLDAITQAMTVNETSFFRDERIFQTLRERIAPELARPATPRFWSAAASTGQEAWSIALTLIECGIPRFEIVGTDISADTLARAEAGLYSQFEVQRGLTIHRLVKHFQKENQGWRIAAEIRSKVRFQLHNLLEDAAALGRFDVVFLRNVMIYFDLPTKRRVLDRVYAVLAPGGYLCLGGTETLLGITERLQPSGILSCLYRRAS